MRAFASRCLCLLAAAAAPSALLAQTKLLRFPALHGDRVAFTHGGDLWTAPASGGTATRLTAHPGLELFPRFSPDGKWIAFTGQYDGDEQVYVMPSTGGVPRQLTFYPAAGPLTPRGGYDHQVMGWTPDGKGILFRSMREADGVAVKGRLYVVPFEGGPATPLPMPDAGAGAFSPDGKSVLYSPRFRDFRHWKRYQGGWAQDLYLFDLATQQQKVLAPSPRTERDPMWVNGKACFASDRTGTLNLYEADPATGAVRQLTSSTTWDARWPSTDGTRIVYESNGELRILDPASGKDTAVSITVPTDGGASRPSRVSAERQIEGWALSPKGERVLMVARGDVFTLPIEKGPTRNLTNSSSAHDKHARWSPDGRRIAFVSDLSGEDELYVVDAQGKGKPQPLATSFKAYLYAPEWAPDGARLAISDKDGKLYVVTVADRKAVEIADDAYGMLRDFAWSPDGQFLAFTLANGNGNRSLHIWSAAEGKSHRVTDDLHGVSSPAWDPDGKLLYVLSRRDYAGVLSATEFDVATAAGTGVFAYVLRKDDGHPFPPESDEATPSKEEAAEPKAEAPGEGKGEARPEAKPEAKAAPKRPVVRIDFEGLAQRAVRVPIPAGNLGGLEAVKGHLLYLKSEAPLYGGQGPGRSALWIFEAKTRKETELAADVQGYALSADGAKVLVRTAPPAGAGGPGGAQGGFALLDAKPGAKDRKNVSTRDLAVDRVPQQEWAQIYDEVWRRYRDFFYVKNMHGYDWQALREQYRPWLAHVTHRSDLTYILTELISELNVGHTYVEGGDAFLPERARVGLPGATFTFDASAGRYRLGKIFRGHNEEPRYRSPLTEVGVDAREGDYVLAIDGQELKAGDDPYRLLRNRTFAVTLTLNGKPSMEGARQVTYRPIDSEAALRYLDFVLTSKERVDKLSGGKVGYMHIPDMGGPGMQEFLKWYYPQIRKEGLLVDVRANGGGNISQMILSRLSKKLWGTRFGYASEFPTTYPSTVFHGPMAALISETSASDGDIFPYHFRFAGLGPLIGKRTWGGVVGISNTGPLIDGGSVSVPQSGTNAPTGEWIIEGEGVSPDIEVENDPASVLAGRDLQLERGVAEVMKRMAEKGMKLPTKPADPVKTK
jgi:tricorn protease